MATDNDNDMKSTAMPNYKTEATELVELDIGWIVFWVPQST